MPRSNIPHTISASSSPEFGSTLGTRRNTTTLLRPSPDAPTPAPSSTLTISSTTEIPYGPLSLVSCSSTVTVVAGGMSHNIPSQSPPSADSLTSKAKPSTSVPLSSSTLPTKSTSYNKNVIIGGVVGCIVGLLAITALLLYYLIRRSRRGKKHNSTPITAVEISPESMELISQFQINPPPPTPAPDISITDTSDQNSLDITMPQRDSVTDQSMSHLPTSSQEFIRSSLPTISHSTSNLNTLLRDILNATQGRIRDSLNPGDPNISRNIQIIININQPLDTNGSMSNENRENRVTYHRRSLPRDMDIDTLSLPPSYE